MLRRLLLLLLLAGFTHRTVADPFPLPMAEERRGGLLYFPDVSGAQHLHKKRDHGLVFESMGVSSDILDDAFDRYKHILSTPTLHLAYEWEVSVPEALLDKGNQVRRVLVYVQNADQTLDVYTDETYSIRISSPDVTIEAQTVVCLFSVSLPAWRLHAQALTRLPSRSAHPPSAHPPSAHPPSAHPPSRVSLARCARWRRSHRAPTYLRWVLPATVGIIGRAAGFSC